MESRLQPVKLACWLFAWPLAAHADSILGSKHDLSVSGPGPIKAVSESEVCVFCHTPHNATGQQPLWNHTLSVATYVPYSSSTVKAAIGQPTGASKLCLSCHDGTVALGMVNSRATPMQMQGGITTLPPGSSRIGTDLSDDHPISFVFDSALTAANGQLKDPGTLLAKVRLDHNNEMQCTSCHNPHDNQFGKFLVQNNLASALCVSCHNMNHWQDSVHRTSNKTWNGAGINPWPRTDYHTVSANACQSCHAPHGAGTRPRLLTFANEEQNCNSCHDGNVAAKNVQIEFNKASVHPVLLSNGIHDPTEDALNPTRHVECVDCHNPHAARSSPASVPNASGALAGVAGINAVGTLVDPITKEYELCFRCHGDSAGRGSARVTRQFVETNTRLEFRPENQSFHPLETVGKNLNVPSLIAPWTTSSLMYCTDCHNNDQSPASGGTGPNGPHGSAYTPILERELVLSDNSAENFNIYALCYKCHDRNSILSDQSFSAVNTLSQDRGHRFHIVEARASCTTCHDAHGVKDKTHLINFNTLYVTASSNGKLEFVDTGTLRGNCSLTCHGKDHNMEAYAPGILAPASKTLRSTQPASRFLKR